MRLDGVDSPTAKVVLLYLTERGPATPRQFVDELDISLLAALDIVDTMCREGIVERRNGRVALAED